jgi:integrase
VIARSDDALLSIYRERYEPSRLLGCARHTKYQYLLNLRRWGRFLGRPPMLSDLVDYRVAAFLSNVYDLGGSAGTVNTIRKQVVSLWRYCAEKRLVEEFPDVRRMAEPSRNPEAWTTPELKRLIATCEAQIGQLCGVPAGLWWPAIHRIWLDTGERKTAALMMEWPQISFERGGVLVPAEHRKGSKDDRWYSLKPATFEALDKIRQPERLLVFPWPLHPSSLYNHYKRILIQAGLPTGRFCGPQRMRRSHATHLEVKLPGAATESLGHSRRSITVKSYLDRRILPQLRASDHLPDV